MTRTYDDERPDDRPVRITGRVLTWMIEDGCVDRDKLAQRLGMSVVDLMAWEAEHDQPTRDEWRKLAEILRRPTAAFLLPVPPTRAVEWGLSSLERAIEEALLELVERVRQELIGDDART